MPLLEKIERIRYEMMLDPRLPMAGVVREANAAMGVGPYGTLTEQAEILLTTMGVAIPPARPMPTRKVRDPASKLSRTSNLESPQMNGSADAGDLDVPAERKKKKRPPPKFLLDEDGADGNPASPPEPNDGIPWHLRPESCTAPKVSAASAASAASVAVAAVAPNAACAPSVASSGPQVLDDGIPWHLRPDSCAAAKASAASSAAASASAASAASARPRFTNLHPGAMALGGSGTSSLARLEAEHSRQKNWNSGPRYSRFGGGGDRFGGGEAGRFRPAPTERETMKQELLNKTRLCRNYQLTGECYHGNNCFFAHGESELKTRPGRPNDPNAGGGSAPQPVCLCLKSFSGCRLWPIGVADAPDATPRHAVRPGDESGVPGAMMSSMLGDISQLCATFYHANSWEADVKLCLHWPADASGDRKLPYHELTGQQKEAVRRCSKSQVAVIARLVREGQEEPLYVARYANCFRGNTDANVHAEEFLITDASFLRIITSLGEADGEVDDEAGGIGDVCSEVADGSAATSSGGKAGAVQLLLYMTYQPCHHSGGRVPRDDRARAAYVEAMPEHSATCSERLRDWYLSVLQPKGVALSLILADVYKATWEEELHPTKVTARRRRPKPQAPAALSKGLSSSPASSAPHRSSPLLHSTAPPPLTGDSPVYRPSL